MRYAQKLVSLICLFALIFGMTSGVALAQGDMAVQGQGGGQGDNGWNDSGKSSTSMELALNVGGPTCTAINAISFAGSNGVFGLNADRTVATTSEGAIKLGISLGCVKTKFHVDAKVSDFVNEMGKGEINGERLRLTNTATANVPGWVHVDPIVNFAGDQVDREIIESKRFVQGDKDTDAEVAFSAYYTGVLDTSGLDLESGVYSATLLATLTLEGGHGSQYGGR